MKSSEIKPGVKATTKLSGRDQVVTVIGESLGKGGRTQWIVRTPAGNQVYRTARQLRAAPMGDPLVIWDECPHAGFPQAAAGRFQRMLDQRIASIRATADDGIDAVEDRAHARAMREKRVPTCSGCGHPHGGPDCAVF